MRRGGFILLALVLIGFVFAPVWEERTTAILSRSVAVVDSIGVLYEASFPQALPSYRFPVLFNINYSELSYPSGLDQELFSWAYGNASLLLDNVSSVGIVFAPLGIAVDGFDPLADPLVSIVVERAQLYASAKYDIVIALIGSDASLESLVALLDFLESRGIWYGLYGFSHGIVDLNSSLHGVIVYSGVSGVTVVNGEILRRYLGSVSHVSEFVWVACGIEDEFEAFGEDSFAVSSLALLILGFLVAAQRRSLSRSLIFLTALSLSTLRLSLTRSPSRRTARLLRVSLKSPLTLRLSLLRFPRMHLSAYLPAMVLGMLRGIGSLSAPMSVCGVVLGIVGGSMVGDLLLLGLSACFPVVLGLVWVSLVMVVSLAFPVFLRLLS